MIGGTSFAGRFDIYEPMKVLWFGYMEEVVCNGDVLIRAHFMGVSLEMIVTTAFP